MHHATYLTRTALTTMGDTGTLDQVADHSPPREKLLAQLEGLSTHRNGRLFDFIKCAPCAVHPVPCTMRCFNACYVVFFGCLELLACAGVVSVRVLLHAGYLPPNP